MEFLNQGTYKYGGDWLPRKKGSSAIDTEKAVPENRLRYLERYTEAYLQIKLKPEEKEELKAYASVMADDAISYVVGRASARKDYDWKYARCFFERIREKGLHTLREILASSSASRKKEGIAQKTSTGTIPYRGKGGQSRGKPSTYGRRSYSSSGYSGKTSRNRYIPQVDDHWTPVTLHGALRAVIEYNAEEGCLY